mmetsp:Transcript_16765/g.41246  ORF Transcript_16765/g.41246 Transcript_16765/m.41246 type:complete len:169 (+) Transcript_16765:168-674(+)|eukprot:CAMPEP_0198322986 /NCGR_PEP_ID=MMETSP1450-20131203/11351_1 /TAXON_ID=753684 ORGANISM="Madagascaria erythrocladiodes, Strain CCMP3234" /NCGR_SAMPLE_ID=MMETSP1450 /ASSEMBLY_ACC=CAM_ASM_001115 /LENGTH=168 /DNA_ID=CAMNT_0044026657 /DNA_START=136 /DNA_END=642 /DNA_ORIENTATION=+
MHRTAAAAAQAPAAFAPAPALPRRTPPPSHPHQPSMRIHLRAVRTARMPVPTHAPSAAAPRHTREAAMQFLAQYEDFLNEERRGALPLEAAMAAGGRGEVYLADAGLACGLREGRAIKVEGRVDQVAAMKALVAYEGFLGAMSEDDRRQLDSRGVYFSAAGGLACYLK